MSDIDSYPRVPVNLDGQEAQRRDADAINYLLGRTGTVEDVLVPIILLSREYSLLQGTAVENTPIDTWADGGTVSPETQMTVDPATGLFTIATAGTYSEQISMTYTGAGNNVQYGLAVFVNGVQGATFSYNFWTNQTSFQSFNGTGMMLLAAGDTVGLVKSLGGAMTNINGSFQLKLVKPS